MLGVIQSFGPFSWQKVNNGRHLLHQAKSPHHNRRTSQQPLFFSPLQYRLPKADFVVDMSGLGKNLSTFPILTS